MTRWPVPLAMLAVLAAACSTGPAEGVGEDPGAVATLVATAEPTRPPATNAEAPGPHVAGLARIESDTPVSGGGPRPVLSWDAVDGAADYVVTVYTGAGDAYWVWVTPGTRVRIGLSDRADEAPGPRVVEGMSWVVVARDAHGVPIGSSALRPIAP